MKDELEDNDDTIGIEIPKEKRYLNTASYDFSVFSLVEFMSGESPKIILEVPFQRNFIWKEGRASQLVESLIMNVPIPPLYFAEEENGKWLVIDGLQRLNSIIRFAQNEYELQDLEIIKELENAKFKDLPPKAKSLLNDALMRVNVIKKDSHPDIKYDIFMRLNKGSVSLNHQELRNCLYRGHLNDQLREFVEKDKSFQAVLNLKKPHSRFLDVELIFRFFALEDKLAENENGDYHIDQYSGRMVNFINGYMEEASKFSLEKAKKKREQFAELIQKILTVFPVKEAFKDPTAKKQRFNRGIAEVLLLSFNRYSIEQIEENKEAIKALLIDKINNDADFKKALSQSTSNTDVINSRVNLWLKAMENAI